jgi:hypothetical protein
MRTLPSRILEDLQRWTDAAEESELLELAMRFRWVCAELQAGNAFSYATLEAWRSKADAAIRGARSASERGAM